MPEQRTQQSRTVALFLTANFLYWIALYIYVPTLSTYVGLRTPDLALVGLVLSMYGLWQAFARFPVGIAVDAAGTGKPFIIVGFLLAAAGALTMGWSRSVLGLAIGRGLTGLAAATWVPLVAIFSGLFVPEQAVLATSLINLTGSIARMVATGLNGFANQAGGYGLTFVLAAGASLLAIVVVILVPLQRRTPRRPSVAALMALARRREVALPTIIQTVLVFGEWAVTMSFLPLLAADLGADDVVKGLIVSVSMAANTVGNLGSTWLERRMRHAAIARVASFILVAGIACAAIAPSVAVLFVAAGLVECGMGLGYPTLVGLMLRRVDQSERSTAAGLHQSVYAVGMFGGPWVGGILAATLGLRAMFAVIGAFVLGASVVLMRTLAYGAQRPADARPRAS
jgi:MFS transporter, DHA1 family, multidrug resistance protein